MSDSNPEPTPSPSSRLARLVPLWTAGVLLLFFIAGWRLVSEVHRDRADAIARHKARIEVSETDKSLDAAAGGDKTGITLVRVGAYVDRMVQMSIREASWTADFFLWFVWEGKGLNPGDSFRVVDGEVEDKAQIKTEQLPDGRTYALYRVRAKVTKFFTVARFPADDHMLTLRIEDAANDQTKLRFVADTDNSAISSRVRSPGYKTGPVSVAVMSHAYKTTHGDPRLAKGYQSTYSQFIYAFPVTRDGAGFYLKIFQGLFAAVAIAFIAFWIKPTDVDPRFGLGVGAFFAAIANCYITAQLLPDTGELSLADTVNGFAIGVIFLTLVQSTISLYIYDILGQEALARKFDKASIYAMVPAFAIINFLLYNAAVR